MEVEFGRLAATLRLIEAAMKEQRGEIQKLLSEIKSIGKISLKDAARIMGRTTNLKEELAEYCRKAEEIKELLQEDE